MIQYPARLSDRYSSPSVKFKAKNNNNSRNVKTFMLQRKIKSLRSRADVQGKIIKATSIPVAVTVELDAKIVDLQQQIDQEVLLQQHKTQKDIEQVEQELRKHTRELADLHLKKFQATMIQKKSLELQLFKAQVKEYQLEQKERKQSGEYYDDADSAEFSL